MRKIKELTLPTVDGNRDSGKTFVLKELPADQAERWAFRMLLAISRAGGKLPDGALEAGMAGVAHTVQNSIVAAMRAMAGLQYDDVEPLLDIMFACIKYKPGEGIALMAIQPGEGSVIEEVSTRMLLRWEVLQLHLNFSIAGNPLTSAGPQSATS